LRKLTAITLNGEEVYGDLKSFGNLTLNTSIDVFNTSISGTIESLIQSRRNAGQTTGTIKFGFINPNKNKFTFNGVVPTIDSNTANEDKVVSWDATTITFQGVTVNS
jgi:hypothetical protein